MIVRTGISRSAIQSPKIALPLCVRYPQPSAGTSKSASYLLLLSLPSAVSSRSARSPRPVQCALQISPVTSPQLTGPDSAPARFRALAPIQRPTPIAVLDCGSGKRAPPTHAMHRQIPGPNSSHTPARRTEASEITDKAAFPDPRRHRHSSRAGQHRSRSNQETLDTSLVEFLGGAWRDN